MNGAHYLRNMVLIGSCALIPAVGLLSSVPAQAADQICTFQTEEAYYASVASPAEPLSFQWNTGTGQVINASWLHGSVEWFSFAADPGSVTVTPEGGYYNLIDIGITTAGYETTRYSIKGYIATNIALPNVTFAGVFEGTGTDWFVAHGTLTCVPAP